MNKILNPSNISKRTKDFKPGSYLIELCLLSISYDQWFKSYRERKWLRNFTFCVSTIVKRYPAVQLFYTSLDIGHVLCHTSNWCGICNDQPTNTSDPYIYNIAIFSSYTQININPKWKKIIVVEKTLFDLLVKLCLISLYAVTRP